MDFEMMSCGFLFLATAAPLALFAFGKIRKNHLWISGIASAFAFWMSVNDPTDAGQMTSMVGDDVEMVFNFISDLLES